MPGIGGRAVRHRRPRIPRRPPRWLLLLVVFLGVSLALLRQLQCSRLVSGAVESVPSGQRIVVGEQAVWLREIALAPPASEQGRAARDTLRRAVSGQPVRCRVCRRGAGRRAAGSCRLKDGTRLASLLVRAGLARDCPAVSGGIHAEHETARGRAIPLPERCRPRLRRGPWPPLR